MRRYVRDLYTRCVFVVPRLSPGHALSAGSACYERTAPPAIRAPKRRLRSLVTNRLWLAPLLLASWCFGKAAPETVRGELLGRGGPDAAVAPVSDCSERTTRGGSGEIKWVSASVNG